MNNKKLVRIKIKDLENYSCVEKRIDCDVCRFNTECKDMTTCPIVADISRDVSRTSYNIDKSVLHIHTAAYGHDCRRVSEVVNMAINSCRHNR